jgi:hypothetical protein
MIVDTSRSTIIYNRVSGRYRDSETGQFVPRERVLLEVDRELTQTKVRLQGVTRLLAADKLSIDEWQSRMIETIKDSHLRMSALGSGGSSQLSSRHFGYTGQQLRTEYDALVRFSEDLKAGKLTPEQALKRAGMYGESTALSFHRSEQITKERDGFEAKRSLDPGAQYCESCLGHVTYGWVAAGEVMPAGSSCECRRRCRCIVVYRRRRRRDGAESELGTEDQS